MILGTPTFTATDSETHAYLMAGTYTVSLTVSDDDGGAAVFTAELTLG